LVVFLIFLLVAFVSFTDVFFESMSGFTTTGASIFMDVENCQLAYYSGEV